MPIVAPYLRFEIFIPRVITRKEIDQNSGQEREFKSAVQGSDVAEFIEKTLSRFGGVTESNPNSPPMYKGRWLEKKEDLSSLTIDYLNYFVGLVRYYEADEAKAFFEEWKIRFEESLNQKVILIQYWGVETIGDFM